MEYMRVKEAAEKWNVSVRRIQRYCLEGRIPGARKSGSFWEIPWDAQKPEDPRRKGKKPSENLQFWNLMPLMNTPFQPGSCQNILREIKNISQKDIALAEYHYFNGHAREAAEEAKAYLTCRNIELRLSACLIYAYASLTLGEIPQARQALEEIKNTLKSDAQRSTQDRIVKGFIASTAAVLLHLPLPEEIPSAEEFMPFLPLGLRAFALYVQAHYFYLQENYEKSTGIIESALIMGAQQYPIPAIYLHLAAVMSYMSLRQPEKAKQHLIEAWEIAQPDGLIEGFAEHHGLLCGMLEAVMRKEWPEEFKRIIEITYEFSSGWRKIHNSVTGKDVADDLTTTEFVTAMLAARNWTNREIADHMNISINTVKYHISRAMKKLNVVKRKDLKNYLLQ